ncbi:hypothetical protein MCUN1_002968 [Malassezia cuniculi]|uniref:Prefoldin subunit 1 n=1 Tax=Malassezia cuniculi TaxID=948313 RepID=A0AAF0F0L2_9BASI|nr:hypothetical protein MCUN1_002968 [Malassezia cuniculi]
MSGESLPQIINSIQSRLVSSQREIGIVQAKMQNRQREAKAQNLTLRQLRELEPGTRVYKSVGRMFLQDDLEHLIDETAKREQAARDETEALSKKHSIHEKQAVDAQSRLNDIVRSLEQQQKQQQ